MLACACRVVRGAGRSPRAADWRRMLGSPSGVRGHVRKTVVLWTPCLGLRIRTFSPDALADLSSTCISCAMPLTSSRARPTTTALLGSDASMEERVWSWESPAGWPQKACAMSSLTSSRAHWRGPLLSRLRARRSRGRQPHARIENAARQIGAQWHASVKSLFSLDTECRLGAGLGLPRRGVNLRAARGAWHRS